MLSGKTNEFKSSERAISGEKFLDIICRFLDVYLHCNLSVLLEKL